MCYALSCALAREGEVQMKGKYRSLLASLGFVAFLLLAQTDSALAAAMAPSLGTAASFAVLGGSAVTNTGNSIIKGDLGLSPGTSVTGFPPGIVVPPGTTHVADAVALGAQNDATTAYNNLAGQACDFGPFGPTDLTTLTQPLSPGVYCFSSTAGLTGTLTLNGSNTDVWVFKIGSAITTSPNSSVGFTGGGLSCNVFWQVTSSATLDTNTTFQGTIIALQSITMNSGATLNGRALARNGAVTLINDTIDASVCAGVPAPGGVGLFKAFRPSAIGLGDVSTLTITLTNTNAAVATLSAPFTDTLPAGLVIAGTPNVATTCGVGVPTAMPGGSAVTLPTGSTIPRGSVAIPGFCTLRVNVTAAVAGSYLNTVPVGALQVTLPGPILQSNTTSPAVEILTVSTTPAPALSWGAMIMLLALLALFGFAAIHRRAM
jgi:uncharacterized repeat protein (TIGR01451 family)